MLTGRLRFMVADLSMRGYKKKINCALQILNDQCVRAAARLPPHDHTVH